MNIPHCTFSDSSSHKQLLPKFVASIITKVIAFIPLQNKKINTKWGQRHETLKL